MLASTEFTLILLMRLSITKAKWLTGLKADRLTDNKTKKQNV